MQIIDITRPVQDAPIYPGSSPVSIERVSDMSNGRLYNSSIVTAGSHMGTHADAYSHFLVDGSTIDQMDLVRYYGSCRVLTVPADALILQSDLEGAIDGAERLLLRTGGFSYLSPDAAKYIIEHNILTVLTDALSVAPPYNEAEVHQILLKAGVAIIENVSLDAALDGEYILSAFPVKYSSCDGAPVRAVLIKE